ncbi:hypothetical protein [Fibrobacter sp.]|uniref:hypothetical protein n=1 Tax=Fibrobacter sp. TaxID=35828 RepID=UPI00386FB303
MLQRLIFGLLSVSAIASATAIADNQAKIDSTVDAIESRKGVDIGGTVRAVYNKSNVDAKQDVNAFNTLPDREIAEFVQLDLDMHFRPWDFVGANIVLRLGAGMQDYFANSATTVNAPWINLEGNIGNKFHWTAGDFRQQYSPLTVYMPGVDIMYEPMIFARNREMAQKEAFIEGNQRNLQGLNLQFRTDLGPTVGELRAEGFFARLRRAERLDTTGAEGNLLPGEDIWGASQAGTFDKYAVAANLELYPLNKNLMVGVTFLDVWDDKDSKAYTYYKNDGYIAVGGTDPTYNYIRKPVNFLDSLPQSTQVFAGRFGADVAGFMGNKSLIADLTGEVAYSMDKIYAESAIPVTAEDGSIAVLADEAGFAYDTLRTVTSVDEIEKGLALNANLNVGYKTDRWMAKVSVDYIRNDSSWYNSLAQSPSFIATRVMNSDKDGNLTKYGPYAPLYSTFDALYFFTPKHAPISQYMTNDDAGMENGQTKSYNIAPYSKTSYTTATYTRKELALIDELSDANVQMALPNGLATTNRTGVRANVVAGYGKDNMIEVQGLFTKMDQVAAIIGSDKISYTEFGGGAKVDVLGLLGFSLPLELSGSYKHAERSISSAEFKTDFINAGIYARYWKRLGVSAGFQMINAELNESGALLQEMSMSNLKVSMAPVMKGKQMQWMVGLDYTLAPHAWLAINYGQATVKNTYSVVGLEGSLLGGEYSVSDNSFVPATETNLPDYVAIENRESTASQVEHEFTRSVLQATINVEF